MNVFARYWNHWVYSDRKIGVWEDSDRYGYWHKPNSCGRHRSGAFDVQYRINANRRRVSERDDNSSEIDLAFIGCSWTFGHGVEDNECFPYLVGERLDVACENYGVGGWGTGHAFLVLEDLFAAKTRVKNIVYLMIPHHLRRNGTRLSWVRLLQRYHRRHPHFQLSGSQLAYRGLCLEDDTIPDDEDWLDEYEAALTVSLLNALGRKCVENAASLHIAIAGGAFPYNICRALPDCSTPIDLTGLEIQGFWRDEHPNPGDHQRIASEIAKCLSAP